MIEILESRELTDKEKRKYEIQQELEKKKREIEELESLALEVDSDENAVEKSKIDVHVPEELVKECTDAEESKPDVHVYEKSDTDGYDDMPHGRARLQQKIGSLTSEEEKIVSEVIKKDNQKDALSEEELAEIRERSKREYDNITSDIRFSPKRAFIFMAVMFILVILCTIFGHQGKTNKDNMQEALQNDEEIIVEVELE